MCYFVQAEIERLKAAVQQKDNDLWTVTKDKERFQGRASAGEATVKSQKVCVSVYMLCVNVAWMLCVCMGGGGGGGAWHSV